ncbi:diguanylate cyclase, partial [Francisellaceae bacterium]|nr:diguanylate cyclase [Francisellaceae bacterium]
YMTQWSRNSEYCDNIKLNDYFHIQDFGGLIVCDIRTYSILSVSDNLNKICSLRPEDLLNKNLLKYLNNDSKQFLDYIKIKKVLNPASKLTNININGLDEKIILSAFVSCAYLIVEIEPFIANEYDHNKIFDLSILSELLNSAKSYEDIFDASINEVYKLTNYRSIMMYQFQNEDYGRVVHHFREDIKMPDFTDHCFPSSDTPKPVRDLFLRGLIRYIPDINYSPSELLGLLTKKEIDISACSLKGVVPIHLTYLENIGSKAAISIPIIIEKKLWGLIACHHSQPKHLSVRRRKLLTILSSIVSLSLLSTKQEQDKLLQKEVINSFKEFYESNSKVPEDTIQDDSPIEWVSQLDHMINFDGIVYAANNSFEFRGECISSKQVKSVFSYFKQESLSKKIIYLENDDLKPFIDNYSEPNSIKSLALVMINPSENIYLMLFRLGDVELQKWAGNPSKVEANLNSEVSPRKSFESWQEEHANAAKNWDESEVLALEQIQILLTQKTNQIQLAEQAYYDQLTGLYNRHYLEDAYARTYEIARRRNNVLSLCIIDVDFFKDVNDDYGHDVGDKVLSEVSALLLNSFRAEDIVCRYGGEEFVVIMLGAPLNKAIKRCEALRARMERYKFKDSKASELSITVSIGVTTVSPKKDNITLEEAIKLADEKLYDAKESGRNKVLPQLES